MQTTKQRARSHSARAAAYTRRAESYARMSADFYQTSRRWAAQAATLTQNRGLWFKDYTPALLEENATTWKRIADTYLRMSFAETASAAYYRQMAANARALAAEQEA